MKRGAEWYKRDPIDYLNGVQGLGPELIGAYSVLLDLMYARGGETVRDDLHLAGIMGCSKRKASALTDALIAREKIIVRGEFITNSRVEEVATTRRALSEQRSAAGRRGGENSGRSRKNKGLREANTRSKTNQIREEEMRVFASDEANIKPSASPPVLSRADLLGDAVVEVDEKRALPPTATLPEPWLREAMIKGTMTEEEAALEWSIGFVPYWSEKSRKKDGRKNERGWKQTWLNFVTGDICQRRLAARRRNAAGQGGRSGVMDDLRELNRAAAELDRAGAESDRGGRG